MAGLEWGANGRLVRSRRGGVAETGLTQPEASVITADMHREAQEDATAQNTGNVRGTGLLTHYRPTQNWSTPGPGSDLGNGKGGGGPNLADASLGEPTSYNGGGGAPAPVEVMKGRRTTYVNATPDTGEGGYTPTVGTGSREYASLAQAGQGYNQAKLAETGNALQYGEYVPEGGEKLRLQAALHAKDPAVLAQAAEHTAKGEAARMTLEDAQHTQNVQNFTKRWQGLYGNQPGHGSFDSSGTWQKPTDPNVLQDLTAATEHAKRNGVEAGVTHFQQSRQSRQYAPLFTPDNLEALRSLPGHKDNQELTEAGLNFAKQNPQAWRDYTLHYGPQLQRLQTQGAVKPATPKPWYELTAEAHM